MLSQARQLLSELHRAGAQVEIDNGALQVTAPPGVLTVEVKQALVDHKDELLALIAGAVELLGQRGVRLISPRCVGIWQDVDGPEVRAALIAAGQGDAEVRYLDDPDADIASRYRTFVPEYVQKIWDQKGLIGSPEERIAAEWKARLINRVFDKLGTSPHPSRITAATVLHGELRKRS